MNIRDVQNMYASQIKDERAEIETLLENLTAWAVANLSRDQRKSLADTLTDGSLTFASPIIAAKALEIAAALAP